MQVRAKLSYLRQAPRKVRLVCDTLRGLDAGVAENKLDAMSKAAALPVLKLLKSAVANAENNDKLKKDNLLIKEIRVDQGPSLKRWRARAFGRAAGITKKSSHVIIILEEKVPTVKKKKEKKKEEVATKVVKSIEEAKQYEKQEQQEEKPGEEGKEKEGAGKQDKEETVDGSRQSKDRHKQHVDKSRQKKEKSGWKSRVFRRKSD